MKRNMTLNKLKKKRKKFYIQSLNTSKIEL